MTTPLVALDATGAELARLTPPPSIEPRSWLLAVMAVQLRADRGGVTAVLRVHATGAPEPTLVALPRAAVVHLALGDPPAALPALAPPALAGAAARLAVFVDGAAGPETALSEPSPGARAFGHVFARWLRDGGSECGYDLTDFRAVARGAKYPRLASASLLPPALVSYALSY